MKSPMSWYGGKYYLSNKLLTLLPEKRAGYIEVFGGGAQLLFAKKPEKFEVYNDLDGNLVNFFRVLRDDSKVEQFIKKVKWMVYSREDYKIAKENYDKVEDEVERAFYFYSAVKMSMHSVLTGSNTWSYSLNNDTMGWGKLIADFESIHNRLRRVQIENLDFRDLLTKYDREGILFYLDPPYVHSTRKINSNRAYKYEMDEGEHKDLINLLLEIKGMAVLSGYESEIYKELEDNNWKRFDFETVCRTNRKIGEPQPKRIETVWVSPNTIVNKQEFLFKS